MGNRAMGETDSLLRSFISNQDRKEYENLHWEGSFDDYLKILKEDPKILRTSFQRLYDMVMSFGKTEYIDSKKKLFHYAFFDDPMGNGKDAVFGLDVPLMRFVNVLKSAAMGYGTEKRVILLHGPVGSAKSTIARLVKKGIEHYSKTDEGKIYTFEWHIPKELHTISCGQDIVPDPMNEEPLKLLPYEIRDRLCAELGFHRIKGDLNPASRYIAKLLMEHYNGDVLKVLKHVTVKRLLLSEKDRVGIGTFQPKDEKNQDSTELTGDINYRKIAEFGSDSDPRAFNFDGEFCVANRGIIEFIEILKLDVAFLYDLLGATQEHKVKPKKFAQTDIDEVIIAHTNGPEYNKLQSNEYMEAMRDRTLKVDIPYVTQLDDEVKIYRKDYNPERIRGKHIAPHTLEVTSMWAVLTRLEEPKTDKLTLMQKLKLYNGKTLSGFTADNIKELKNEAKKEGMFGISPRYVQDKISNALVSDINEVCVNPFMVMNEVEEGLKHHSLITTDEVRKRYKELLAMFKEEYEEIVKNEVQRAIAVDEEAIKRLCGNYIDNIKAYTQGEKEKNKYTGRDEEPSERLMRSIEEKIDVPDNRKDDFRREVMNYIGALAVSGKIFDYKSNERLHRALEMKLFEDQKDSIKLSSLVCSVVDKETQEKIDIVK